MTDRRPYRRPLRWEAALARIRKEAGAQFDPDVVDGLLACEPDLVEIRNRFVDSEAATRRKPDAEPSQPGVRLRPVTE
jgi:putative two-component system response regulator